MASTSDTAVFLYQDLPYAAEWPRLVPLRLLELDAVQLSPVTVRTGTKARAIAQYDPQVPALRRYVSTFDSAIDVDEPYWQVTS